MSDDAVAVVVIVIMKKPETPVTERSRGEHHLENRSMSHSSVESRLEGGDRDSGNDITCWRRAHQVKAVAGEVGAPSSGFVDRRRSQEHLKCGHSS